ncbi:MAG: class I SAM-dependent methyltransferase [Actinomycetota bacterium]
MSDPVPDPPPDWYRPLAAHLREAYLRYSFTYGTAQEAGFLWDLLQLREGDRLLDVGSGPGRHSLEFARRGASVVAVDLSPEFAAIARERARSEKLSLSVFVMNALEMPFDSEFDAVISICEGAFGLGLDDLAILRRVARALKPGSAAAIGAPNVFYVAEHLKDRGRLDPSSMMFHEKVEVVGASGDTQEFEMWNSCYTPREMAWIANGAGLDPEEIFGIAPGSYRREPPSRDHPELLLLARRPEVEPPGPMDSAKL